MCFWLFEKLVNRKFYSVWKAFRSRNPRRLNILIVPIGMSHQRFLAVYTRRYKAFVRGNVFSKGFVETLNNIENCRKNIWLILIRTDQDTMLAVFQMFTLHMLGLFYFNHMEEEDIEKIEAPPFSKRSKTES